MAVRFVLGSLVAALALALAGTASAGLTLGREDAPGYGVARGVAAIPGAGLPTGVAPQRVERIRLARGSGKQRWTIEAVGAVFAGPAGSRSALARWRTALVRAGANPKAAAIGTGGVIAILPEGTGSRILIGWRSGAGLGVVGLRAPTRAGGLPALALAYARLAAQRLADDLALTPLDRVLRDGTRKGRLTPKAVLQAFTLAVGPLPGVQRPPGKQPPIFSVTPFLRLALAYEGSFTQAQRDAIDAQLFRIFGDQSDGAARRIQGVTPGQGGLSSTFKRDAQVQAAAEAAANAIATAWGRPLGMQIVAGTATGDTGAVAQPWNAQGKHADPLTKCSIAVFPDIMAKGIGSQEWQVVVTHEVFHCFEAAVLGWKAYLAAPTGRPWLLEGIAHWAALDLTPVGWDATVALPISKGWAARPTDALFARVYAGSGFWGMLKDRGLDPWGRMSAILQAGNDPATYATAVTGGETGVLNAWGSSFLRRPDFGLEWTMRNPVVAPSSQGGDPAPTTPLGGAGTQPVSAGPYAARLYELRAVADAPLVHVQIPANARLGDGTLQTIGLADAWFCTQQKCECPPDEEGKPPAARTLAPTSWLGVAGGASATQGTVTFESLKKYCKRKREEPKPPEPPGRQPSGGCFTGCGTSNGDPHQTTFDGLRYDFQAVGEFTLAKSTVDDLEVQVRQESYGAWADVSVITTVALRVAGRRVQVDAGEPLVVRVDGAPVDVGPGKAVDLGNGARLVGREEQVEAAWPDGTLVRVWSVGSWGVATVIRPAPARAGTLVGLLGNADGSTANDFATRGGQALDAAAVTGDSEAAFDLLYRTFGDSWRIAQAESLFTYPAGRTTDSYTDRSRPTRFRSVASLPASDRDAAEALCRAAGVTDPALLPGCILDVAVTGEPEFATSAAIEQATTGPPPVDWHEVPALAARIDELSLAATSDGVVHAVAAVRQGGVESVIHVPLAADGSTGAASTIDSYLSGKPQVVVTPQGTLLVALPSIRQPPAPGVDEIGTFTYSAPATGATWTRGPFVATLGYSYVGRPWLAFEPGGELFTALPTNGVGVFMRGTGKTIDQAAAPVAAGCYGVGPAVAADGTDVWAAWTQWSCAQVGLWVVRLDPSTGVVVGSPVKAPESSFDRAGSESFTDPRPATAIATRPGSAGTWVAYGTKRADGFHVLLWRIGAAAPIDAGLVADGREPFSVMLSSDPSGRLWVAWVAGPTLVARRLTVDASGVEPGSFVVPSPTGDSSVDWAIQARAGVLDVVSGTTSTTSTPGRTFRTTLAPG